ASVISPSWVQATLAGVTGSCENVGMAEQKTLPTDANVYEFLESATPAKRREDALEVDALMREVTGVEPVLWGPSMVGYGSFRYISAKNPRTRGIWPPVAFSPRKASLTFYGLGDM